MILTDHYLPAKMEETSPTAPAALTKAERTDVLRDKVFGTTELLEDILLRVADDFKTLLLSQRVCKDFHATIEHSTSLQKALFSTEPGASPSIPRMLIYRKIKIHHDGATFFLSYESEVCGSGMNMAGIDPWISYEDMTPDMRSRLDEYNSKRQVELDFDTKQMPNGEQRAVEVSGSWQKMPLIIRKHHFLGSKIWCNFAGFSRSNFNLEVVEGETLGTFVDKALRGKEKE